MRKFYYIALLFLFLFSALSTSYAEGETVDTTQQPQASEATSTAQPEEKNLIFGFDVGLGITQPLIPKEFESGSSLGLFEAKSKVGFSADVGFYINYYFTKVFGITAGLGYEYIPFDFSGESKVPSIPSTYIPFYGMTPSYGSFTGYLRGKMHFLYFKVGPAFRFSNFFINVNLIVNIHLHSTYTFYGSTFSIAEQSGDYDKKRAAAIGISLQPGYRIPIGRFFLPLSLEFKIFITPLGETNIMGTSLPAANIYTWSLKFKIAFEF